MAASKIKAWPVLIVLGLGTMISHGFGLALIPAMLPRIEEEFQSGYGALGVAIATGLLAYAAGAAASSRVLRILPTRTVLVGTFMLTGAGMMVAAIAGSPAVIGLGFAIMGVSAPISWTTTTHVATETVAAGSLSLVIAGSAGGSALGVLVNGVLVQTSESVHSWRVSFVIAALISALVVVAAVAVFGDPVPRPSDGASRVRSGWIREVLTSRAGRLVVITSGVSGIGAFTFSSFLTATAIDEMGTSSILAASLLWVVGVVGMISAPVFGRVGDRISAVYGLAVIVAIYAVTLIVLVVLWGYVALLLAAVGLGIVNYPVWGLVAVVANRQFPTGMAVRAVSLGLLAAAGLGAVGNAITGVWIDNTGSIRIPLVVIAVLTSSLAIWLMAARRSGLGSPQETSVPVRPRRDAL